MKKVCIFFIMISASIVSAQKTDPFFVQSKNYSFNRNFKTVFVSVAPSLLKRTEYNFKISAPERKPVFCRMEDKLCNKFNVWLQLRAGSDLEYRKLAFPEEQYKTKRSQLIE